MASEVDPGLDIRPKLWQERHLPLPPEVAHLLDKVSRIAREATMNTVEENSNAC